VKRQHGFHSQPVCPCPDRRSDGAHSPSAGELTRQRARATASPDHKRRDLFQLGAKPNGSSKGAGMDAQAGPSFPYLREAEKLIAERLREADERRFAPLERRPVAAAPRGRLAPPPFNVSCREHSLTLR
jgi:hypothetical protein